MKACDGQTKTAPRGPDAECCFHEAGAAMIGRGPSLQTAPSGYERQHPASPADQFPGFWRWLWK